MMKFVFLALLFFIYYIAGMYESPALMVLFLTQFLLLVSMLPLARYLNRRLSVCFSETFIRAEKDRPYTWRLKADNRGKLPVGRFALRISDGRKKRRVYASAAPGESILAFEDTREHCGIFTIRADRLKVYDYLSLFSGKQRLHDEMRVAVFPVRYAMRLENADSFGSADSHLQSPYRAGSVSGEIRQIREYRDGDRIRYIHWNQTARTGEPWVKEYEEEQNGQYSLYLERRAGQTPAAFAAYCTLLDALLSALLAAAGPVRVLWREAQYPGIRDFYVRDGEQCRELLYLLYQANKFSVPLRCSALMGILLAVLVGISAVLTSFWGSELSAAVYKGEGFISRSALRLTGRAADPNSDGHVSSGNNYRTGEQQLEVTLPQEPTQTLYLKGFTGGRYSGGEWEAADDEPVFQEMARDLEWERWETWISAIYDTLYFIMNRSSKEDAPEPRELTLEHTNGSYRTLYMPYFSGPVERRDTGGYGFHYYQEAELDLDWEYAYERNSMMTGWMWQVQDAYIEEIPNAYTEVPVELLPRLTQLCRANPADSLEEATALILTVLRENASYTLMPGRAPLNEDIVEYFLFENHEGYCVHFASAATLMYRLWGIPARYASGYALQPSDFTLQPDGTWKAEVTDAFAHAWTEIFLEDYGWTPVEFTPSADGSFDASYPGLDTQALTELLSTVNLRAEISGSTNESSDSGTESGQDFGEGFPDLSGVFSRYRFLLPIAGTALVISLLLIPLFLDYRRLRRRAQAERMNCREVFRRLMDMIHFAGFLSGCSGMEEDFAARFEKEIPCTEPGDAQRLVQIVSRAAYGRGEPSKEKEAFVKRIYFSTGEWLTGELKGFRRFQFRYLKAFF